MHLYIMRHGIAVEGYEWAGPDATRPLTPEGITRTRQVLETLKKGGKLEVTELWASPLVRAQQTAAIAGEVLGLEVQTVEELACGANVKSIEAVFSKLQTLPERLMTVGHEPDCGELIAGFSGDFRRDYALKKAGIALLKGEPVAGKMEVKWKLAPADVLKD
jgi:phosphohistidine phosphatase